MFVKNYCEITENFDQKFYYPPLAFGSVSTSRIYELLNHHAITKTEVEIMKFLYKFKFASVSMIKRYIYPDYTEEQCNHLKSRLINLVKQRILNMFVMTDEETNSVNFDFNAEILFTLDYGAITILRSLLNDENIDDWKATDIQMSGAKVAKAIMCAEFYHRLQKYCPNNLEYYVPYQAYAAYQTKFENKATFKVKNNVYMLETVRESDLYDGSDTKVFSKLTKYEKFLNADKTWQYYFEGLTVEPILVIACDTIKAATMFAQQVAQLEIPHVRYICLNEDLPLSEAFLKFEDGKLKRVRANSFTD